MIRATTRALEFWLTFGSAVGKASDLLITCLSGLGSLLTERLNNGWHEISMHRTALYRLESIDALVWGYSPLIDEIISVN
jgi:hypothetical protein